MFVRLSKFIFTAGENKNSIYREKISLLENRIAEIENEIHDISASDCVKWLVSHTLSKRYMNVDIIEMLSTYLQDGRADNLKEAINLLEEELHRGRVESMQRATVNAVEQVVKSSSETAADVKDIKKFFDSL